MISALILNDKFELKYFLRESSRLSLSFCVVGDIKLSVGLILYIKQIFVTKGSCLAVCDVPAADSCALDVD